MCSHTNLARKTGTKAGRPKYIHAASETLHSFATQFNKGKYPSNFIYETEKQQKRLTKHSAMGLQKLA